MAKDFPKAEAGTAAPADQPEKVGPVAGHADPEPSTKAIETATPNDHAKAMGGVKKVDRAARVNNQPATFDHYHEFHAAASALHGWPEHEHHEGKGIQLSREDYEAALRAAAKPVTRALDKDGKPTGEPVDSLEMANKGVPTITDYEPHKPALSPHRGKGL